MTLNANVYKYITQGFTAKEALKACMTDSLTDEPKEEYFTLLNELGCYYKPSSLSMLSVIAPHTSSN